MSAILAEPVLLVLFFLIFYPCRWAAFQDKPLSAEVSLSLRGLFAIIIVLHHLGQQLDGLVLLPLCKHFGYLGAGVFFFLSGYGLQTQYLMRENYADGFLRHRLGAILIPYGIMTVLYWAMYAALGQVYALKDVLLMIRYGDPIVSYSWYIVVIALFYLAFWGMMLLCRNRKRLTPVLAFAWYLLFLWICKRLEFGSWWYNTCHLLILGMLTASNRERLFAFAKKRYVLLLAVSWIGFCLLFGGSSRLTAALPVLKLPLAVLRTSFFVAGVVMLTLRLEWHSPIAAGLGRISQEIYLCQGLWLLGLRNDYFYIQSDFWMCILTLAGTLLTAWVLNRLWSRRK